MMPANLSRQAAQQAELVAWLQPQYPGIHTHPTIVTNVNRTGANLLEVCNNPWKINPLRSDGISGSKRE
jgi:hypothetical protein